MTDGAGKESDMWIENNVFLADQKELKLDDYMQYDPAGRGNLGNEIPVFVYRLLEYSMREELSDQFGKEEQIRLFRNAGYRAGEYFARRMLDAALPFPKFFAQLQELAARYRIGVLRIEHMDEDTGTIILTVAEDVDCSGLPLLGETVCNYDEGFISGILSTYTGKEYLVAEIDCWAAGDRVCRFRAETSKTEET